MGLFYAAYNGYVWKALFLYRHPERIGGIFLAHRYSAVWVIAENGNASAKGIRKRGKGETFCERSKKEQSARKISRCARNDGRGNGFISRSVQRICLESAIPVSSSRAKPSIFLAHRYSAVCVIAEKGKTFAKGARKNRVQGRFLAALEMTVGGNGFISRSVQRICLESAIPVSSPRAKPRDLSCRRG